MFLLSTLPTIVLGDFNLHWPLAVPLHHFHHSEIRLSEPFFDLAADRGYELINTPGIHTYFPHAQRFRPSTLDLAFTNPILSSYHTTWNNNALSSGSDHTSPHTRIYLSFSIPPYSTPDWNNIDWSVTSNNLKNLEIP
jgi:endonuclease/exonuclease/phosphatase family metal-dependent hydrolase